MQCGVLSKLLNITQNNMITPTAVAATIHTVQYIHNYCSWNLIIF